MSEHREVTNPMSPAALPTFIAQDDARYDAEDHDVWRLLFERRMRTLAKTGSRVFLDGMATIGLSPTRVPRLTEINAALAPRTGWSAVGVGGFIPAEQFFRCLAVRRFPTTLIVRSRSQLDYLPEPDIFHDVFGHVPLHAHAVFGDFLQRFGVLAAAAATDEDTLAMARLFWFTVEFGLIREQGKIKIYGSGLISSHGDAANALGSNCDRRSFQLDEVLRQPFEIDRLQDTLFVIENFDQLFDAVETIHDRRRRGVPVVTAA